METIQINLDEKTQPKLCHSCYEKIPCAFRYMCYYGTFDACSRKCLNDLRNEAKIGMIPGLRWG